MHELAEFLQRRGLATWDYRLIESDLVPDDVRYQVLAAAKGRCALCGTTSTERRIEADHIIPRSRGGSNDISNLQALCDHCNRGKSNRDATDFRVPEQRGDLSVCATAGSRMSGCYFLIAVFSFFVRTSFSFSQISVIVV